jgi:hypothetical protein
MASLLVLGLATPASPGSVQTFSHQVQKSMPISANVVCNVKLSCAPTGPNCNVHSRCKKSPTVAAALISGSLRPLSGVTPGTKTTPRIRAPRSVWTRSLGEVELEDQRVSAAPEIPVKSSPKGVVEHDEEAGVCVSVDF